MPHSRRTPLTILLVLALAALVAAGCGSDDDTSDSGTTSGASAATQDVRAEVAELLGPTGTYRAAPTSGPAPARDVKVTVISPGLGSDRAWSEEPAGLLGWDVKLVATNFDPAKVDTAVRAALHDGTDAIVIVYTDCPYIKGALREAKAKRIPVAGITSVDCDDLNPGDESLFAATTQYVEGEEREYNNAYGEAMAKYAIARDPRTHMVVFGDDTYIASKQVAEGYERAFKTCEPDCKLTLKLVPATALGQDFQSVVQQTLLQNPDATAVGVTYEGIALAGVIQGVAAAGDKLPMAVGEGSTTLPVVRKRDAPTFGVVASSPWIYWSAFDNLNRILQGEDVVVSGIGVQLFDKDDNIPASGPRVEAPRDFKADYRQAWGGGA